VRTKSMTVMKLAARGARLDAYIGAYGIEGLPAIPCCQELLAVLNGTKVSPKGA
jgi:hypothetical protein